MSRIVKFTIYITAEHVYEINFIPGYLNYLMSEHKISCDHILQFFFLRPRGITQLTAKYGYRGSLSGRLMDQLASNDNKGGLAVLDKNLNMLKHRVSPHPGQVSWETI